MRLQPLAVVDQERAADAVVGDQVGEAVENAVEHVLGRNAVLGVLDQLEQPLQLGLAVGEFGRQRHQSWPRAASGSSGSGGGGATALPARSRRTSSA